MPAETKTRKAKEPSYVRLTLEWCNRQRKKRGKEPLKRLPRGYTCDPQSCPCGTATGLRVGRTEFTELGKNSDVEGKLLPQSVRLFVDAFDRCELPQYIKD